MNIEYQKRLLRADDGGMAITYAVALTYGVQILLYVLFYLVGVDSGPVYDWVMMVSGSLSILGAILIVTNGTDYLYSEWTRIKKMVKEPIFARGVVVVGICLCMMTASSILLTYLSSMLAECGYDVTSVSYPDVSGGYIILGIVVLCIFPAVSEEMLTRGVLLRSLKKGGSIYAILMSGLLFAVLHGNPLQLVHQFVLGCVLAYLVTISGSILPSIFAHFLNNLVSVVSMSIMTPEQLNAPTPSMSELLVVEELLPNIVIFILFSVLLIVLVRLYTNMTLKIRNESNIRDAIDRGESVDNLPLMPTLDRVRDIPKVISYLDEEEVETDKSTRLSKWLCIAIGILVVQWVLNTLVGFGIIGVTA